MQKHTNLKRNEDESDEEAIDCDIRGADLQGPLLPSIKRTVRDTTTSRLLASWMSLSPLLKVRPLSQRGATTTWHRPVLHSKMELSPWPSFAIPLREKRWMQPMEDCC